MILLLLLFIGLIITQELFHRYPRFTFALFVVAPVILFSCWLLLVESGDTFAWVKVLSIASGIILLSLFRTTKLGGVPRLVQWVTYAFLVVNIFEAVTKDVASGTSANYLNALAGLLLIATLEKLYTIHIDHKEGYRDLYWSGMTLAWIIGYTAWNWVFVYLNYGLQSSMMHVAVLGAALVVGFVHHERWLQARVLTLGTFFIIFHSFPHLGANLVAGGHNQQVGMIVSFVSSGFMIAYTLFFIHRSFSTKKNVIFAD